MKNPLRKDGPRRKDVPPVQRAVEPASLNSSTRLIKDNFLVTKDGTWAWFRLGTVPWAFRSPGERSSSLDNIAQRWAELHGFTAHIRVTSHPVPYSTWAERLYNESPNRLEDQMVANLTASQERIRDIRSDSPGVYVGVRFTKKTLSEDALNLITSERAATNLNTSLTHARGEL